jgi:outer membrane protein OmpA-like peptidoglycan-associated protein
MKIIKVLSVLFCVLALLPGCKTKHSAGKTATGSAIRGAAGAVIAKKMDTQRQELKAALPKETTIESVNKGEALKVTFGSATLFNANSNTISAPAKNTLLHLANSLKNHPGVDIRIIGHTDHTGKEEYNRILSLQRAKSIYNYLAGQGVDPTRMAFEGRGFREPSADNGTTKGRMLNRRIEIFIFAGAAMIREARDRKK